jgi:hypothetical protein
MNRSRYGRKQQQSDKLPVVQIRKKKLLTVNYKLFADLQKTAPNSVCSKQFSSKTRLFQTLFCQNSKLSSFRGSAKVFIDGKS